jgi:lysozyme family protein
VIRPSIDDQIAALLKVEGGYVNNSADRGGPTMFGITQAVARAHGYAGDMRALPASTAAAIYKADYWTKPHFDLVAALAPSVAAEMFDTGVNCGVAAPVMFLQRALNVVYGCNLKIDGGLAPGGATLVMLLAYLRARPTDGAGILLALLNCFQGERYAELVERDPTQRQFINGWIANRVEGALA